MHFPNRFQRLMDVVEQTNRYDTDLFYPRIGSMVWMGVPYRPWNFGRTVKCTNCALYTFRIHRAPSTEYRIPFFRFGYTEKIKCQIRQMVLLNKYQSIMAVGTLHLAFHFHFFVNNKE